MTSNKTPTASTEKGPYKVELDLYIARRRRLHEVRNPAGEAVFHAQHVMNVLEWLADNNIGTALFTDGDTEFTVSFARLISPPPQKKEHLDG